MRTKPRNPMHATVLDRLPYIYVSLHLLLSDSGHDRRSWGGHVQRMGQLRAHQVRAAAGRVRVPGERGSTRPQRRPVRSFLRKFLMKFLPGWRENSSLSPWPPCCYFRFTYFVSPASGVQEALNLGGTMRCQYSGTVCLASDGTATSVTMCLVGVNCILNRACGFDMAILVERLIFAVGEVALVGFTSKVIVGLM